jgi:hypothetical protein
VYNHFDNFSSNSLDNTIDGAMKYWLCVLCFEEQ